MRTAIIGGGPGGLMSAYLLEQRSPHPHSVTLFEASRRLGGKILTRQFSREAVSYEAGVAELYDYSQIGPDPLRELIESLGLPVHDLKGGVVVMGDRILETADDIRREFGPDALKALRRFTRQARSAISPAEYYESDWTQDNADPLARQSFRELLDRVPDADARRYIEVAVHSDLATEPDRTNAMYGLQNFLMDERDYMRLYRIEGGIERLPQGLARRIGATVLLEHPVVRVERTSTGEYRVFSRRHGEHRSDDFDRVIVALPNNWIPAVEWGGEALETAMRRHHSHYNHPAHYLRVSILFDRPFWREKISGSFFMLDAFGGCCVYDESSRGPCGERGVLGWLLAGDAALNLSNFDDDELVRKMLDSLPASLRHGRDFLLEAHVHRWVGTVNGLPGGYPLLSPEARHLPEPIEHPGLFVVGDYLFDSTLNGVLDSADFVTDLIVERTAQERRADRNGNGLHPAGNDPSPPSTGARPVPLKFLPPVWQA
jgi:monoamine oxidase